MHIGRSSCRIKLLLFLLIMFNVVVIIEIKYVVAILLSVAYIPYFRIDSLRSEFINLTLRGSHIVAETRLGNISIYLLGVRS